MIAELFLTCALAVPARTFTHVNLTRDEAVTINILSRLGAAESKSYRRVLVIGDATNWIAQLRGLRIKAYGVHRLFLNAAWYIQAEPLFLPIGKDKMQVVVYVLKNHPERWVASLLLNSLISSVAIHGFFVFDKTLCPHFIGLLEGAAWVVARFEFRKFSVYEKVRPTPQARFDRLLAPAA